MLGAGIHKFSQNTAGSCMKPSYEYKKVKGQIGQVTNAAYGLSG